jgi:predicted nicotinamide N-methyase
VEELLCSDTLKRSSEVNSHQSSPPEALNPVDRAVPSTSSGDPFRAPKWRNRKFLFKPFVRQASGALEHNEHAASVEVIIPEQLAASYGLYIWPSSSVLSWYIWLNQEDFAGKIVLELGAGTSLPGLLSAKIGASKVYLSDCASNKDVLHNCQEAVKLNGLERTISIVGLTWGLFSSDIFQFSDNLDYIIGSDLFFDPDVFETLCATISLLLQLNPRAAVLVSVQERSEDWTVEEFLLKWKLRARYIYPREFLRGTGIEEDNLTGKHKIYIIEISRAGE